MLGLRVTLFPNMRAQKQCHSFGFSYTFASLSHPVTVINNFTSDLFNFRSLYAHDKAMRWEIKSTTLEK